MDNGIYILPSPVKGDPNKMEYRVSHCAEIHQIDSISFGRTYERIFFEDSAVYNNLSDAMSVADDLYQDVKKGIGIVKHGVIVLKPRKRPFPEEN